MTSWRERISLWRLVRAVGQHDLTRLALIPLWTLDPMGANFADVEPARCEIASRQSLAPEAPEALRVMTWNIKYGGARIDFFYDGHGDRVVMERAEVLANLEGLAAKIRQVDPDVLLLQEVDVGSRRSARVDELIWLLEHTSLNFAAYASQWRVRHVPSHGIGEVDAGVAILSRYPLAEAERVSLPLIDDQDGVTQYFFLRRCLLTARVDVPGRGAVRFACLHSSAFTGGRTRALQIAGVLRALERFEARGETIVLGGDFNVIPPFSERYSGYEDLAEVEEIFEASSYEGEAEELLPLYERLQAAVPLERYREDNAPFFTHSTTREVFWNRKLDYLFTSGAWREGSAITHQDERSGMETMSRSDHAPLSAELELA